MVLRAHLFTTFIFADTLWWSSSTPKFSCVVLVCCFQWFY